MGLNFTTPPPAVFPSLDHIDPEELRKLTKSAVDVLRLLLHFIDQSKKKGYVNPFAYPSQLYMANKLGYNPRTIGRAIHQLQKLNIIIHHHRRNSHKRQWRTNLYKIGGAIHIFLRKLAMGLKPYFSRRTFLPKKDLQTVKTINMYSLAALKSYRNKYHDSNRFILCGSTIAYNERNEFLQSQVKNQ